MAINIEQLKAKIIERNTTQAAVAAALKINRSTFCRKLQNGGQTFTIQEVRLMSRFLALNALEIKQIFFE